MNVKKIVFGFSGFCMVGVGAFAGGGFARWDRQREAPMPDISASEDPAVIARGEYLVWGPGHCAGCHGAAEEILEYEEKAKVVPLTGGFEFYLPPGKIVVPNITQDPETGIGDMSDAQIARSLRHGVGRHGTMLFPIMPFQHVADDDLTAIISYLRTVEPVKQERPNTELSFLGKMLFAYVMEPAGPVKEVQKSVEPSTDADYGQYLVESVANCYGCHTNRDLATGEFFGEPLGGGLELEHRGTLFVIPNITQGEGSRVKGWTEEGFIARVRTGQPSAPGSPMPWAPLSKASDDDLKAIWAHLSRVDPVDRDTGPSVKVE
jgi:mono/diheme cytochrome c family protein